MCNRLSSSTPTGSGKSHQEINVSIARCRFHATAHPTSLRVQHFQWCIGGKATTHTVCRGLAGVLLPLRGGGATHSAQPMADLATIVTPEPALRFAELWASPAGTNTGTQSLVQQLSSSMPRYTTSGSIIKTGSSLVVARGQLAGPPTGNPRCCTLS